MRGKRLSWAAEQIQFCCEQYRIGAMSTRDLAAHCGCSFQSIAQMLKINGILLTQKLHHIGRKAKGRPSPRKGARHTLETREAMSRARKGRPSTTRGKIYTTEERANISAGLKRYYSKCPRTPQVQALLKPSTRVLLTSEERSARNHTRAICKRFIRRLINMARIRKHATTEKMLGYTKAQLRAHLEAQFRPGMSWEKRESFHVDHKTPVVWFLKNGITNPATINALSNLQVLTPDENRRKSAHFNGGKATYTAGIA